MNYNSTGYLERCLRSLSKLELAPQEILVYDNSSSPRDRARLIELTKEDYGFTCIFGDKNLGFGAGVNRAIMSARSGWDYVWVLNPDMIVAPSSLGLLSDAMTSQESDIASPLILDCNDKIWFAGGDVDTKRGRATHVGIGEAFKSPGGDVIESTFITGAAPLVSRRAWKRLGGFREDLFLYWEDADLSLRAMQAGYRMIVVPEAKSWHHQGGSSEGGVGPTYIYYVQRNRIVLFREYGPVYGLLFGRGGFETFKLATLPFRSGKKDLWQKVVASLRGMVDGIRVTL
ncbi:GT2 family glycosyltransferase [Pseudarthrobacter defluvii]|uniref:GT2 family glycosyltransferase n=1 Tax=Pseudarthrobacter defluvii TaxID=410837 RepID=A0ABT9UFN3_9MICC|nr:GT2 family glycosyltransferase [Pseudarthrobacter defluvii]